MKTSRQALLPLVALLAAACGGSGSTESAKPDAGPAASVPQMPSNAEIAKTVDKFVKPKMYRDRYADVFTGDAGWRRIKPRPGLTYAW